MYIQPDYTWQGKNVLIRKKKIQVNEDLLLFLIKMSEEYKEKQIQAPLFLVPMRLIYEELKINEEEEVVGLFSLIDTEFSDLKEEEYSTYYKIPGMIKIRSTSSENILDIYPKIPEVVKGYTINDAVIYHEFFINKQGNMRVNLYLR